MNEQSLLRGEFDSLVPKRPTDGRQESEAGDSTDTPSPASPADPVPSAESEARQPPSVDAAERDPDTDSHTSHGDESDERANDAAEPTPPVIGEFFARHGFTNLRFHAQGGLGQIWLADDTEFNREVAIKVMRADVAADAADRSRFIREAEITGALEHPGIVPICCKGELPDGSPFYAMRFIRGRTLAELTTQHFLSLIFKGAGEGRENQRRLLKSFVSACYAVGYGHSKGVIHRDLKPENIIVGEFDETYVLDWGLARSLTELCEAEAPTSNESAETIAVTEAANLTMDGFVVGSVCYLSPEQAEGRVSEMQPPTDVFNLGATLYHIITGRPPYSRDDGLDKARLAEFLRPSRLRHDILDGLENICLKAMSLSPADRYQTAAELGADVERCLAGEQTIAGRSYRLFTESAICTAAALSPPVAFFMLGRNYQLSNMKRQAAISYGLLPFSPLLVGFGVIPFFVAMLPLVDELQGGVIMEHRRLGGKTKGVRWGIWLSVLSWLPFICAWLFAIVTWIAAPRPKPTIQPIGKLEVFGKVTKHEAAAIEEQLTEIGILKPDRWFAPGTVQIIGKERWLEVVLFTDLPDDVSSGTREEMARDIHQALDERGMWLNRVAIVDTVSFEPRNR